MYEYTYIQISHNILPPNPYHLNTEGLKQDDIYILSESIKRLEQISLVQFSTVQYDHFPMLGSHHYLHLQIPSCLKLFI